MIKYKNIIPKLNWAIIHGNANDAIENLVNAIKSSVLYPVTLTEP